MTDPVLLLDSTVLVAYERDLTRRAQALALEALADGRLMVTAALSLAVACTELSAETRELAWLIYDRDGSLGVPPLRWRPVQDVPHPGGACSERIAKSVMRPLMTRCCSMPIG